MNYTLHQLQIFCAVAQAGSVTKAAEELHLTQPAVSIQLKNFQDQFDIPLTEVIGRRIHITDFGKEIALAAETILAQVHAIQYKTAAYKGQLTGRIKISVVSTGKYVMPHFLADFLQAHSGIELVMDVTNKQKVIDSLAENDVDLALVSILPTLLPVEHMDLLQNKLFLVGRTLASSSKKTSLKEAFKEIPLIFREPGSGTRQSMERFIERHAISVVKKLELTSNEAVKQAVLAGLGYSVMPLIGLKHELLHHELHIIPISGLPITTTWRLIWLKGKKHSPAVQAYLDYLDAEKARIIHEKFSWYEAYLRA